MWDIFTSFAVKDGKDNSEVYECNKINTTNKRAITIQLRQTIFLTTSETAFLQLTQKKLRKATKQC